MTAYGATDGELRQVLASIDREDPGLCAFLDGRPEDALARLPAASRTAVRGGDVPPPEAELLSAAGAVERVLSGAGEPFARVREPRG
ncbi:hypothetical protein [Streptomyces sp. NPDC019224]|uniref:hypothetical protein n=1 Tax=Streptomyces sp. NPDC019224 TaxID=3154484 RepID=UPI0033F019FD